jgi:hypothetical protein
MRPSSEQSNEYYFVTVLTKYPLMAELTILASIHNKAGLPPPEQKTVIE